MKGIVLVKTFGMSKITERVPRLKLDDFAGCIQGRHFIEHHLKFPWGYNGFYSDTLQNFQHGFEKLPKSYVQDFYNIYILRNGEILKINQTQVVQLNKDKLYISKPGQMKHWERAEGLEGYFLAFSREYLRSLKYRKNMLADFPFLSPHKEVSFHLDAADRAKILHVVEKIHEMFVIKDKYAYDLIQLWMLEVLILLKKQYQNKNNQEELGDIKSDEITQEFLEKLETHFIDGIKANYISSKGVAAFASEMHVEPKVLNIHVKGTLGKSPKTVITERYILAAKCKLIHTDMPISEICYILGFKDPAYFSRIFKRQTGVSPHGFREGFTLSKMLD